MMNSADENIKKDLPPELQRPQFEERRNPITRDIREEDIKLPEFLIKQSEDKNINKQFGNRITEKDEPFSPFGKFQEETKLPKPELQFNDTVEEDDDLGFDVDELVKKIDAKIAELEEEEKKEKEEAEKKKKEEERISQTRQKENSINDVLVDKQPEPKNIGSIEEFKTPIIEEIKSEKKEPINLDLEDEDDIDDDDFFDDFFDN